jgi:hypothetical protein
MPLGSQTSAFAAPTLILQTQTGFLELRAAEEGFSPRNIVAPRYFVSRRSNVKNSRSEVFTLTVKYGFALNNSGAQKSLYTQQIAMFLALSRMSAEMRKVSLIPRSISSGGQRALAQENETTQTILS